MKWIDYREKLGIGIADQNKAVMFKNRLHELCNFFNEIHYNYGDRAPASYFLMVSEPSNNPSFYDVYKSIDKENTLEGVISKAVALANSMKKGSTYNSKAVLFIKESLDALNIPIDVYNDEDGIFIFPKGAKELDDKLISEPLEWLKKYPKARAAYENAIKAYVNANNGNASNVADLCRKALEIFFRDFFKSEKNLSNLRTEYGNYLKEHGVPTELANDFQTLLQQYSRFNDNNAKHDDKIPGTIVEYILYSTGNIMRLLLQLDEVDES